MIVRRQQILATEFPLPVAFEFDLRQVPSHSHL